MTIADTQLATELLLGGPRAVSDRPRWLPGTYTQPLSEDFVSDGPQLRRFVELFCKTKDGSPLVLDDWQAWLVDHALERYPDDYPDPKLAGRLRYQQIVVSVARQNGKSELAQVFGFYGLMLHEAGPTMVSLASNADQANIIYKRVKNSIDLSPELRRRFKTTTTRGITRLDKPGDYTVKPAKADALQGIPVTMCLFDEVHLCSEDMWAAMLFGTAAAKDGLVLGITTAGDDTSKLLKGLYDAGRESAAGTGSERFGFFCWEAPQDCDVWDDDAWLDANPAMVAGRIDLKAEQEKAKTLSDEEVRQFRLNQFVKSEASWLPMSLWDAQAVSDMPMGDVYAIDRTPSWEHATIVAATKTPDGSIYTEVVASFTKPNLEWLLNVCIDLYRHNPKRFVMDGYTLNDLGKELERRGYPVKVFRQTDVTQACATAFAEIKAGNAKHVDDLLLRKQLPFAVKKNIGEGWRITRQASSVDIDAVMATVFAVYQATLERETVVQIF